MNLEDHLGDIIGKARTSANVTVEEAVAATGLSVAEFSALEETGKFGKRPNFQTLAAKLGLHGTKLEGIASGWLPQKRDLGLWRELRQITTAGTVRMRLSCRSRSNTENPSITGIMMSRSTTSNDSVAIRSSAASPFGASSTAYP